MSNHTLCRSMRKVWQRSGTHWKNSKVCAKDFSACIVADEALKNTSWTEKKFPKKTSPFRIWDHSLNSMPETFIMGRGSSVCKA